MVISLIGFKSVELLSMGTLEEHIYAISVDTIDELTQRIENC